MTVKDVEIPDPRQAIREAVLAEAVSMMNSWVDNITAGEGAQGRHHRGGYVNTGEGRASIRLEPETPTADRYAVYSDTIQILIAEVGQEPGHMPAYEAISDWVHERLGVKRDDPEHHAVVEATREAIFTYGRKPFAPMELAIATVMDSFEDRIGRKLDM